MQIITDSRHYADIASAIRTMLGTSVPYRASQMASAIVTIPNVADYVAMSMKLPSLIAGNASFVGNYAFQGRSEIEHVSFQRCRRVGAYSFDSCTGLIDVSLPWCSMISFRAFAFCSSLTEAYIPECTALERSAFMGCGSLVSLSAVRLGSIGEYAFAWCTSLESASLPYCVSVGSWAFYHCDVLSEVTMPFCSSIGSSAFLSCVNLMSVNLSRALSVTALGTRAFVGTPIGGYSDVTGSFGSVYVPSSLYSSFVVADEWSTIAERLVSV